jgi:MFS family permease
MTLGVIVSLFGLGTALVLLFTLAIYAVPFFVGLTVGLWAFETGAGVIGAGLVGIVAGVVALFAAQLLFASVRSLALRAVIALLFAAPAAVAGYHAVLGISALLVPSEAWRHVFAAIGGLAVGVSAAVQLAAFAGARAQPRQVTAGRPDAEFTEGAGPNHPRLPSPSTARLPAPSSESRG